MKGENIFSKIDVFKSKSCFLSIMNGSKKISSNLFKIVSLLCLSIAILLLFLIIAVDKWANRIILVVIGLVILIYLFVSIYYSRLNKKEKKKSWFNRPLRDFFMTIGGGIIAGSAFEIYRLRALVNQTIFNSITHPQIIIGCSLALILIAASLLFDDF